MTTKDGREDARYRRWVSGLIALSLSSGAAKAQGPPSAPTPAMAAVSAALGHMKAGGAPLVVVVTSSARPESRAFSRALIDGAWARANRGLVQVVELPAEGNAAMVEQLRVAETPAVLAYTMGADGPACRGMKVGGSPDEASAWLGSLGLGGTRATAGTFDPAVVTANHEGYPSPQQPYTPSIQAPPAPTPSYVPASVPYTPASIPAPSPTYMIAGAPSMAPAAPTSMVHLPGPNVVVQQGEARVFVAPPSGMASIAGMPSAPASNLYLPASAPAPVYTASLPAAPAAYAPAAVYTPAATYAPAAVYAPAATYAPAAMAPAAVAPAAIGPAIAAVTNQTTALPTGGSRTRIRVRGPGPIRAGLASLGERMTQLGRARIETVQETDLATPAVQGGTGVATFSTSSVAPVGQPQTTTQYVPSGNPSPPPPVVCQPPPVTPSPQDAPHKHGHLFGRDD